MCTYSGFCFQHVEPSQSQQAGSCALALPPLLNLGAFIFRGPLKSWTSRKVSCPEKCLAITPCQEGPCDSACALLSLGPFFLTTDLPNAAGPFSICSQTFPPARAPPFSEVQGSYLAWALAMHGAQQHHSIPLQTHLFFFLTKREETE